ncbi:MAG: hypothetical protein AAGC55_22890 [Myxococcota bacterium]
MSSPVRGRVLTTVLIALVATIVISGWFLLGDRPEATTVVDLLNIDGEYAVVVRDVAERPELSMVSLVHAERGEQWGALGRQYGGAGNGNLTVAATAEAVAVRTNSDDQPFITAFRGRDGEKLGRMTPLGPRRGAAFILPASTSLFDAGQAFELFGQEAGDASGEGWAAILGMDLTNGAYLWLSEIGAAPVRRMWLRPRQVVIERPEELTVIGRDSGAIERIASTGRPCLTDSEIWLTASGVLRAIALPGLDEREIALTSSLVLDGRCGVRAEALILVARGADGMDSDAGDAVIAADLSQLKQGRWAELWRLPLTLPPARADGKSDDTALAQRAPDRIPLAGALTRFVPMLAGRTDAITLVMIDTDSGRVAWRSPSLGWLDDAYLMSAQGRHYLYAPETRLLAAFDGDTGTLLGALRDGDASDRIAPVKPRHIAGNRIWLYRERAWFIVDATRLSADRTAHPDGLDGQFSAVTEQVASELGAPRP